MKSFKVTRISFATSLSVLLCAAVISSCGSSKDSKKSGTPTIGSTTGAPPNGPTNDGVPQTPNSNTTTLNGIPQATDLGTSTPVDLTSAEPAAPIGKVPVIPSSRNNSSSTNQTEPKTSTPDFKDSKVIFTGGKLGDLNYTSASDDGLMEAFRMNASGVGAEQQKLNKNIAQAIMGARLLKSGSDMNLDIALNEGSVAKIIRLKATTDGNKMKLSLLSSTADSEFQGGFLKCLEASCEDAYAKIKVEGGYARIIFRTTNMNNIASAMDSSTADSVTIQLSFADGSIGTVHYFANGSKAFPKERVEVFAEGRVMQLDNFRKLTAWGWMGFKKMNLWRQDKGQKGCAAAFLQAVREGGASPIALGDLMEVSRLAIDIAAACRNASTLKSTAFQQ